MTRKEVRRLQEDLSFFTIKYLHGLPGVRIDGKLGPATLSRVKTCKYYLGYLQPISSKIDHTFRMRLRYPRSKKYSNASHLKRARRRRIAGRARWAKLKVQAALVGGVGTFDGVPCARVAIPILKWCRAHGWRGVLVSGWRSLAHSEHLCFMMCGHPTCPGRCAGRNTNHVGTTASRFALDVTFYWDFGRIVARCPLRPHVHNSLPNDRVHFSPSGR